MKDLYDVVVVGGGPAGASAALMLVRSRRTVLVIDGGMPRNRFAQRMHGVLGHDGRSPAELARTGRDEIARYGGAFLAGDVASVEGASPSFIVATSDGHRTTARRLVVATGLRDELPGVPGLAAHWGRGVVVCPYCDGWELRDRRIGVLGTGRGSVHQAQLVRQLTRDVVYLHQGPGPLDADAARGLVARGIVVREGPVTEALGDGTFDGVRVGDEVVALDALFVAPRFVPNDALLQGLGASRAETAMGSFVQVGAMGETSVPGVWAAGNVANAMVNVPLAMGTGSLVGAAVNADLVADEVEVAVHAGAAATSPGAASDHRTARDGQPLVCARPRARTCASAGRTKTT